MNGEAPWQQRLAALFHVLSNEGRQERLARHKLDHELLLHPLLDPTGQPVTTEQISGWYSHLRRLPASSVSDFHHALAEFQTPLKTGSASFGDALLRKVWREMAPL